MIEGTRGELMVVPLWLIVAEDVVVLWQSRKSRVVGADKDSFGRGAVIRCSLTSFCATFSPINKFRCSAAIGPQSFVAVLFKSVFCESF